MLPLGDDCWLDADRMQVVKDGLRIGLSRTEYRLLDYLAERSGQWIRVNELTDMLWGPAGATASDLYVFIRRLRVKLEDNPQHPTCVVSVRGFGYVFVPRKTRR